METIPPSGTTPPQLSSGSGDNDETLLLALTIDKLWAGNYPPGLKSFAGDLAIWCIQHPGVSPSELEKQITSLVNGTWNAPAQVDVFWHYGLAPSDLQEFTTAIQPILTYYNDSYQIPSVTPTSADNLYLGVRYLNYGAGIQGFVQNGLLRYLDTIGSHGTPDVKGWLDSQFSDPNFAANYPNMSAPSTWNDLEALSQHLGYSLPSFAQGFIESVGYLQTCQSGTDDYKFFEQMVSLCQTNWVSGNTGPLSEFLQNEVANMFDDYPLLTGGGVPFLTLLEQEFGVPVPEIQTQLFQTRDWINGPPPLSGEDLTLAQDFMTQIKDNWPGGTLQNLVDWFNGPTLDIYMRYPLASGQAVAALAGILQVAVPPKTQIDSLYLNLSVAIQAYASGTNPYELFSDVINQCVVQGSNGNFKVLTDWLSKQWYSSPYPFPDYMADHWRPAWNLTSCFGSQYLFQYFNVYIITLANDRYTDPIEKQVATTIRSVIDGYITTHPGDYSIADLNSYLVTYYANPYNDLCLQIPQLTPFMIGNIFEDLDLTDPYPYRIADYAYGGVCQALAAVTNPEIEPDYDMLNTLGIDIKNAIMNPGQYPYQNVLNEIQAIKDDPSKWSPLQPLTQEILTAILTMGPG